MRSNPPPTFSLRLRAALVALLGSASCTPAVVPSPSPVADCTVVDEAASPRITLGVTGALSADDGTLRHLAAQSYEALLRIDCTGALVPGLAETWSTDDGRTWTFRIRSDLSFHDGARVTASAIAGAWVDVAVPWIARIGATGAYDLLITLHDSVDAAWFADPSRSVAQPAANDWPVGTGPFMSRDTGERGTLMLLNRVPSDAVPDTIDVRAVRGDPRTGIDAGLDVLVTDDAATLAYARARTEYSDTPLPWSRTYLMMTAGSPATPPLIADLESLARGAVRADARPAAGPFWWEHCFTAAAVDASRSADIVYSRDDDSARELAERVTALAWPNNAAPQWLRDRLPADYPRPRARAVDADRLRATLQTGNALAVIARATRVRSGGCDSITGDTIPAGWSATALVDTRDHLIYRRGRIGRVTADAFGTIRFETR